MTPLAAYLLLFIAVGTGFIFVHLIAGKLIRPSKPHSEKATIYECGEPTIGSAWIQFDLRFYVVALLFVVFDVEVAFFFPWAEVFGKANAIANAPEPKTATEYNDLGEKILDLAIQHDASNTAGNLVRWRKMRTITDDELKAYRSLSVAQARIHWALNQEQVSALLAVTSEQRKELNRANESFRATFATQTKAREVAMRPFLEKAKDRPPTTPIAIPDLIKTEVQVDALAFEATTLTEFATGKAPLMLFVRPPPPGVPMPPRPLYTAGLALDPKAFEAATATADRQLAEWKVMGERILGDFVKSGPKQSALWAILTPSMMKEISAMTPEQVEAMKALSRDGVLLLNNPSIEGVKSEARSLAWLALGEILVFFGVLLVGFAYLWKRGDLAWVRATVAEQGQYPIVAPPTILAATRPLDTASAGDHAGS